MKRETSGIYIPLSGLTDLVRRALRTAQCVRRGWDHKGAGATYSAVSVAASSFGLALPAQRVRVGLSIACSRTRAAVAGDASASLLDVLGSHEVEVPGPTPAGACVGWGSIPSCRRLGSGREAREDGLGDERCFKPRRLCLGQCRGRSRSEPDVRGWRT